MNFPPVSVVIVSWNRPAALIRCLTGVAQLDYAPMEVIVVACTAGVEAVQASRFFPHVKLEEAPVPNIAKARNSGIALASGDIVAFIDDDAVPEPLWLRHLVRAFDNPNVTSASGVVLGRNGISWQWGRSEIDETGARVALTVDGDDPIVWAPKAGRGAKTEGTNMAFRRSVLLREGGFDEAFAYYLDESDLNYRLGRLGEQSAFVPLAQVHHSFVANSVRRDDRVPRDLALLGRSQAAFVARHCPKERRISARSSFVAEQRNRLLRHMQTGALMPDDVHRLLGGLSHGWSQGEAQPVVPPQPFESRNADFRRYPTQVDAPRKYLSQLSFKCAKSHQCAQKLAESGYVTTLFNFSLNGYYHSVSFTSSGYWIQSGGVYGRSTRNGRLFQPWRLENRVVAETMRVSPVRG